MKNLPIDLNQFGCGLCQGWKISPVKIVEKWLENRRKVNSKTPSERKNNAFSTSIANRWRLEKTFEWTNWVIDLLAVKQTADRQHATTTTTTYYDSAATSRTLNCRWWSIFPNFLDHNVDYLCFPATRFHLLYPHCSFLVFLSAPSTSSIIFHLQKEIKYNFQEILAEKIYIFLLLVLSFTRRTQKTTKERRKNIFEILCSILIFINIFIP